MKKTNEQKLTSANKQIKLRITCNNVTIGLKTYQKGDIIEVFSNKGLENVTEKY